MRSIAGKWLAAPRYVNPVRQLDWRAMEWAVTLQQNPDPMREREILIDPSLTLRVD